MATIRLIQKRIKSARNISQITKAMQMVAASRMRKAQDAASAAKPYQEKIIEAVRQLSSGVQRDVHRLLSQGNPDGKTLVILISTNKGLCGGLNTNLFRRVVRWFPDKNKTEFVTLGKKGQRFVVRTGNMLTADFTADDLVTAAQPATDLFVRSFIAGDYRDVFVVYNHFVSSLRQEPERIRVLPIELPELSAEQEDTKVPETQSFLIEPSVREVLESLLPHYVEVQLHTALLQALASEHSARMIAMKNATDNAKGLIGDLTLMYNRLRQERITYEISDMVTAKVSMD